jgi:phage-related protein (TIGR01555 family)
MTVNRTKRPSSDPTKEILKGITQYLDGAEQPAQAEEQPKPRGRMKVSRRALESAHRKIERKNRNAIAAKPNIFQAFKPAPGVLPKGAATLAMDEMPVGTSTVSAVNTWAWGNGIQFAEGTTFLGYPYLAELTQRPEYRKIIEKVATEMTRKWIKLEVTSDVDGELDDAEKKKRSEEKGAKIKDIQKRMTDLKVRDVFRVAAEHDNAFGRGHIFLDVGAIGVDTETTELRTPIGSGHNSKGKVSKKTPLKAIRNVEPMWAYPQDYNSTDPLRADWYKPATWYVMATPVHASRFLTLVGREVPDILKPAYAFGGLAMSQMAKPYVDNWLRTRQAVCDLIESFSVSGIYTNMASVLQAGDGEGDDSVLDRLELFNLIRTNSGSMALDKETEEFFNISTPLGTLDALQAQAQEQMASVSSIPVAILLGLQPKGLNASSEAEVRIFYDFVHASQENIFRDPLTTIIQMIQLSLWNEIDPEITFSFEPLWSLSDKERAEVKKLEAETGDILIGNGTIDPIEERRRVADDPDMGYAGIDVEDVPDPPAEGVDDGTGDEGDDDAGEGENSPATGEKKPKNPPAGKDAPAQDGVVPFLVSGDSEFDESKHPRDGGKFTSGSGSSGSSATTVKGGKDLGKLKSHPPEKMRDYTPKELDWEYGTEYLKYSKPRFPDAFASREDFQAKYDAAPVEPLSEKELKQLGNSMAAQGLGQNEKWIHDTFSHRRDSARIIKEMKEGKTAPPIILKKDGKLHLMAGQTRLATGAALGISVPAKIIDVSKKQAQDEATWNESDHPRAPDGKFGTGSGSSSAPAGEKAGKAAKKVTAFGGLWKDTGKGEKADYHATAAYYLGQPAKSGTHYRNMLKKLIEGAEANGLGAAGVTGLKAHLFQALATVKNKLSDEFSAATDAGEKKKLEKLFNAATKQQQDLKLPNAYAAPMAAKPAEPSVTTKVAEQALKDNPGMAAVVEKSKGPDVATIKAAFEKFQQNTKGFSAEAMKNPETVAKEKIKAVAQVGGTVENAKNILSPTETTALAKSHHKTVEKNFEVSKNYVDQANKATTAQKAAEEQAKKEAADFEASLNSPEAKEHYEALNGILSGNAKAAIANAAKKLKTLGKAYEKMTPGDAAQVMAYSGSYYREVNNQLRAGIMTEEQYKFAASLNKALDTMPTYEGTTRRGATLSKEQVAMYKPGMIIEERGFTSTSTASGFGGNTRFEVKGKTGRDISKLSHYPGEAEVLFKAGTRFKVISNVDNKITLEEVNFGKL